MISKFRNTIYYKLCGNICGVLSLLLSFLLTIVYFSMHHLSNNEMALLILPIFIVILLIGILDELLFIIFNILSIVAMFKNDNSEIKQHLFFTDVGYFFTFILFFGFKIYLLSSDILSKLK